MSFDLVYLFIVHLCVVQEVCGAFWRAERSIGDVHSRADTPGVTSRPNGSGFRVICHSLPHCEFSAHRLGCIHSQPANAAAVER
jgi:hypothetical protein